MILSFSGFTNSPRRLGRACWHIFFPLGPAMLYLAYCGRPSAPWPSRRFVLPSSRYALNEPHVETQANTPTPDFDGIWKTALQTWLPQCVALFWPDTYQRIDWAVAPVFLDKALRRLERLTKQREKRLDLLAQLALKGGGKALLLLHLEVQAGRISLRFPERMFHYRIRLYERYPGHALLSCAIYLDREHDLGHEVFRTGDFGDELIFRYPVVNLASWRSRMAELEELALSNPFAVVVLAQLACRATVLDRARLASKLSLARQLKKWNYDDATRGVLFQIMDGLLTLPEALDVQFFDQMEESEDPEMMERLNSLQRVRLSREKAASEAEGRQKGFAGLLQSQLQRKFGSLPDWARVRIAEANAETLQAWALNVLDAERLEAVFGD